ncbi:hypothetical protein GCM10011487_00850 [Steroidobacter agaridevorans]|uniref:Sulfatase-modifying factor enzyme domain-containing protein n=1 Tax=Steroidobacter agaridevorans TaxID=2695856 RepID=A0A829Y4Z9_9GAMM|nr:hypothetical protein [Steroidobacter agaridevorans]GFE78085.1 hypothetical protein GCM10011487_00850 [Steroidobacter agaridevorans]GFE91144.1 hypothetical protein GCM10011488_60980 [Steroidobacter agaridevorans]
MDLSADRWRNITPAERHTLARHLASELPSGFVFDRVATFRLGERQQDVALYRNGGASFALLPGGVVTVGYDPNKAWEPSPDELESWQGSAEEYGIEGTIGDYIGKVTLPLRCVRLAPLLMETTASELGWDRIGLDDPEVKAILREHGDRTNITVVGGRDDAKTRVHRDEKGRLTAEHSIPRTHAQLAEELAKSGFRFPSSDEWEYACGAGSQTLFRWGDHVPCDRYPTDISPEEAAWRREWALSGGNLSPPAEKFVSDWTCHWQPNAFGLLIASDPYKYELVAEIGMTRGGDGGTMVCGGVGFFMGWLTLATAYFEDNSCKHDPAESISPGYTIGRRVLELR